jgi:hypothetical protein
LPGTNSLTYYKIHTQCSKKYHGRISYYATQRRKIGTVTVAVVNMFRDKFCQCKWSLRRQRKQEAQV